MSTTSTFADVQQYGTGSAHARSNTILNAGMALLAPLRALRRNSHRRAIIRALEALNNRMLDDIGLDRGRINCFR